MALELQQDILVKVMSIKKKKSRLDKLTSGVYQ